MGMITTIVIQNDYAHDITTNPEFPALLMGALSGGQIGEVVQGCKIVEMHHADFKVTIEVGSYGVVKKRKENK